VLFPIFLRRRLYDGRFVSLLHPSRIHDATAA
jgi:hypothetical protein